MTRDLQCRITNKDLSLICVDTKINGRKPVGLIRAVKERKQRREAMSANRLTRAI